VANWRYHYNIKPAIDAGSELLNSDEEKAVEISIEEILKIINKDSPGFLKAKDLFTQLREVKTIFAFNRMLDKIYNYADDNLIWLGL
jgi:hypothetical protein